jgi:hypothetical protein
MQQLEEATSLQALTLWQPWAWAVVTPEAGKDVENRGWEPPQSAMGKALAIHAGATYSQEAAEDIRQGLGLAVPAKPAIPMKAVVGVAVLEKVVRDSASAWAIPGHRHWVLSQALALPAPVPCNGAQGLWRVPEEVFLKVKEQVLGQQASAAPAGPGAGGAFPLLPPLQENLGWRCVRCVDCGGTMKASGPGPHRHGGHRVGGIDCLGRKP